VSNRELPMMPWYPDQFAAATVTFCFNERSLYRALLDMQWAIGPLPNDPIRLANAVGMSLPEFELAWPVVSKKFDETRGGLVNKRLEYHRSASLSLKQKRAAAGRNGGLNSARAKREQTASNALTVAQNLLPAKAKPPSPSPSPDKTLQPPAEREADFSDANGDPDPQAHPRPGTRANGTSPRQIGTNPRANGSNPRALRDAGIRAFDTAQYLIQHVNGTRELTWAYVAEKTRDDPAIEIAIAAAGGHRAIADADKFTRPGIEERFRAAYERAAGAETPA
jgi:uncharacterized protein YdaU (DUF1376 family)